MVKRLPLEDISININCPGNERNIYVVRFVFLSTVKIIIYLKFE